VHFEIYAVHVPASVCLQLLMFLSIIILRQMRVKMTHDRFWSSLKPKGLYEVNIISKKCYGIHKTGQNNKRRHKKRTRDLWNTRRETQIQTKLDQPPRKNGQHQTPETLPPLQIPRKKGSRTPQETMATRRCRNRSNDLIHGRS